MSLREILEKHLTDPSVVDALLVLHKHGFKVLDAGRDIKKQELLLTLSVSYHEHPGVTDSLKFMDSLIAEFGE